MAEDQNKQRDIATAQAVMDIQRAYRDGKLDAMAGPQDVVTDIMNAPETAFGAIDVAQMSPETQAAARAISGAMKYLATASESQVEQATDVPSAQRELFAIFEKLFAALVGHPQRSLASEDEIKPLMIQRMERAERALAKESNAAAEELVDFYARNSLAFFKHAKSLGGVKLVSGGQRAFTGSAVNAIRISGLYADRQLVPDPLHQHLLQVLRLAVQLV